VGGKKLGYHLKRTIFSVRFVVLFILQAAMYYYLNHWNLSNLQPQDNFYQLFLSSIRTNIPVLALLCAALVGLQTYDELDKNYQPLLFSRASIRVWITRKFTANALTCGVFILLAWVVILLVCFFGSYPPSYNLVNLQQHPYVSIVSSNPSVAIMQMIGLDIVRVFLFGVLLGAVATLGAVTFRGRYLVLAFPAVMHILFDYYASSVAYGLSWYMNFDAIVLAGRYIEPWFSLLYFGLSALFFFALANYFVLRKVRYE